MKPIYKFVILVIILFAFYEISFSQNVKTLKGHTGSVNSIQFFPDGLRFASGGTDDDIFIWNYETFTKVSTIESNLSDILDLKISKDGNYIWTANKYNKYSSPETAFTIGFWDVRNKKQSYPINTINDFLNIDISPDGNNIFCAYNKSTESFWNGTKTETGKINIYKYDNKSNNFENYELDYYNNSYSGYTKSEDKTYHYIEPFYIKCLDINNIAIIGKKNEILIIDLKNKTLKKQLVEKVSKYNLTCMDLSPSKKYLAVANYSSDSWICIWDLQIGKSIKTLKGHEKDVLCLAFSPDGNYLASGGKDNTVRLWDVATGKLIKVLKGHENNVNTLCFSPDGKVLLSGSDDETIKVWNVLDLLPELKIFSINYEISFGIKSKLQEEYNKEYEETITNYYKPKGEFETTDEYNKRIQTGKELEVQLKAKYDQKFAESKTTMESELKSESNIKQEAENQKSMEIQNKINNSTKDTLVNITKISNYNADKQIFTITTKGYTVDVVIPVSDAPGFKENWQKAKVKCKKQLMNDLISWKYFDFVIIHPVSKVEYPASSK